MKGHKPNLKERAQLGSLPHGCKLNMYYVAFESGVQGWVLSHLV